MININVKNKNRPDDFIVAIEISKGSKNKYEIDEETGYLMLNRVLYTSMQYPHSYGFIPNTLCDDNDPLDVFVLCAEPIVPYCLVRCYPVGVVKMLDGGEGDDKIIAIPFADPYYKNYKDISDLPEHFLKELKHFLETYKALESKKVKINGIFGADEAKKVVKDAILKYVNI